MVRLAILAAAAALAATAAAPARAEVRGGFSLEFGDPYPPPRHYHPPPPPRYYGCHPVHTWGRDWYGRPVRIQATECFDTFGRPFIVGGSERVRGGPWR